MSRTGIALLEGPAAPPRPYLRAVEAVYYAFLLAIPLETVLYVQTNQSDPDAGGISASRIAGAVLLGLALVDWRRCFREIPLVFWFLSAYLAAFAVTQLWIPTDIYSRFYMREFTLFQMAALFLVTYNLMRDAEFRRRSLAFYGWIMAVAALAMLFGLIGVRLDSDAEDRVTMLTQDPNLTAGMLGIGALCLLGHPRLLEAGRSILRVVLTAVAVVVVTLAILRTGSRGGMLAFATGLLAFGACAGRRTRWIRLAIMLGALGVGGALIAQEFARGTSTAERIQRAWVEGDTAGRTEIYDTAWQMFKERPWLGWGGGNNRFILGARLNFPDRDTHDVYLAVLTEVGIVGGLPFLLLLLEAARRGWLGGRAGDAMLFPTVCALLVMSASISGYQEKIFWIVLGAAVAGGSSAVPRGGRGP